MNKDVFKERKKKKPRKNENIDIYAIQCSK